MQSGISGHPGVGHVDHLLIEIFRQLSGTWKLNRQLNSENVAEPSGKCEGQAVFTVRPPSSVGNQEEAVKEILYHETGDFEMAPIDGGGECLPRFSFSRKYIWRLSETASGPQDDRHAISIWFTRPGTDELDYRFHNLNFQSSEQCMGKLKDESSTVVVSAKGDHLCVQDMYYSEYKFHLQRRDGGPSHDVDDLFLDTWTTLHTVVGPTKNQRIETFFTRST